MAKIFIDNKEYEVDSKKNLLEACLSLGLDLPYFCWHPAMGSVGACRQCAVKKFKDENDKQGRIVMACMEPIQDGMRISLKNDEAVEFRGHVIEWLMTNHPHDCPICDEGGECHLQDMTVMSGHNYRKFEFKKRTYRNQYLGPFINHEMNRCIQCYRCVRFYRDYAGGKDFDAFAVHNNVYFGRHEEGTLENEFSGNLVEVCPTGVFTDKTLKKHYTRKWDLTTAPSICQHCSLGCNIIAGERYGGLRRILSRYNGEVNGYFICDRGRFGYEFVNSNKRILTSYSRNGDSKNLEPVDIDTAIGKVKKYISESKGVIGIGSPRASIESNFMLRKLVGKDNFYQGVSNTDYKLVNKIVDILQNGPARTPSLKEVEEADAVLVLGEDLTNTAPMLALALRQSVKQKPLQAAMNLKIPEWQDAAVREVIQDERGPLFIASSYKTKLDEIASEVYHAVPDEIARLGFAIANKLDKNSPKVKNISKGIDSLAEKIANELKNAERPLIISGTGAQSETVIEAAANVAWSLTKNYSKGEVSYAVPENNNIGLSLIGGKSLDDAMNAVDKGDAETVIILENDVYRRASKEKVDEIFNKAKSIISFDYLENDTTKNSDIVLSIGSFAESDGTLINNEGRAQRYYQVYYPDNKNILESWRTLNEVVKASGKNGSDNLNVFYDFTKSVVDEYPELKDILEITPPPDFRVAGQKIPRSPHRYSGRTAMHANENVSEPKPPEDPDSPLSYTMEGYRGNPPSSVIPFFWSPGWNSAQSINKFQIEVGGHLHGGDPGKRLFEPNNNSNKNYFNKIPEAFAVHKDEWFVLPVNHIYGSEELSMESEPIIERSTKPYIAFNKNDLETLSINENDEIEYTLSGKQYKLQAKIKPGLPKGVAGLPVGLPDIGYLDLPGWSKLAGAKK